MAQYDERGDVVEPDFGGTELPSAGLRSRDLYWNWWLRSQLIEAAHEFYEAHAPRPTDEPAAPATPKES